VENVQWQNFAPIYTIARPSPLLSQLPEVQDLLAGDTVNEAESHKVTELRQRLTSLTESDQHRLLLDLVSTHAAVVLGRPPHSSLGPDTDFKSIGFTSLTAVELRNHLAADTGLSLPTALVYDYPHPTALARYLRKQLVPDGDGEAEIRTAIASIPLATLRGAGLMQTLLSLAAAGGKPAAVNGEDTLNAIDAADTDDLVRIAAARLNLELSKYGD
jgi:hypothetical protein